MNENDHEAVSETDDPDDDIDFLRVEVPTIPLFPLQPSNLNFADGITGDTLLIDIPFTLLGTFVGTANSMAFIPKNFSRDIRKVFIKYIRNVAHPGIGKLMQGLSLPGGNIVYFPLSCLIVGKHHVR